MRLRNVLFENSARTPEIKMLTHKKSTVILSKLQWILVETRGLEPMTSRM